MSKNYYCNDEDFNYFYKELKTELLYINKILTLNFLLEDEENSISFIQDFFFNKGISILEQKFEGESLLEILSKKAIFNIIFSFKNNENYTIKILKTDNIIDSISSEINKLNLTVELINKKNKEDFFVIKDYILANEEYRTKSDKKVNVDYLKNIALNTAQNIKEHCQLISYLEKNELCNKKFLNHYNEHKFLNYVIFLEMLSYFGANEEIGFTKYENKIGLFIDESNQVILNFPYKDCFLLGGMDKDDDKINNEFMLNEIINKNSLERIFERKAFCNFKNFGTISSIENKKETLSISELDTIETFENKNLLIKGNNLIALHSLKSNFLKKIDVIYIDPPYYFNETKAIDSFAYNSNFKLSTWLVFMKNRLEIARELLSDDGVIFISMNEDGNSYLKILCDEIFGVNNFIGNIHWNKGYGKNDSKQLRDVTENILCFSKNKDLLKSFSTEKNGFTEINDIRLNFLEELKLEQIENPEIELQNRIKKYYKENPNLKGISSYDKVEEKTFRIYRGVTLEDPKGSNYTYDLIHPNGKICKIPKKGWNRPEKNSEGSMDKLLENNEIIFGKDETTLPNRKYYLDTMSVETPANFIYNTQQGGAELKEIMNKQAFSFPKHTSLIKYLINFISKKDALILDFFGGSGTTGHAVMDLNKEDGGNRKFIMIEQMDYIEYITAERLKRAMVKYGYEDSFIYMELKENKIREFKRTLKNLLEEEDEEKAKNNLNKLIEDYFLEGYFIEEYQKIMADLDSKKRLLEKLKVLFAKYIDHTMDYVNFADMDNPLFEVSLNDKFLNNLFYK